MDSKLCQNCDTQNPADAAACYVCGISLSRSPMPKPGQVSSETTASSSSTSTSARIQEKLNGSNSSAKIQYSQVPPRAFSQLKRLSFSPWIIVCVISGGLALALILSLGLVFRQPKSVSDDVAGSPEYGSIADVPTPSRRFTFSGDPFFAALSSRKLSDQGLGLNQNLIRHHPEFELIYLDSGTNPSSSFGIDGVIKGYLSFATIARPLTNLESDRAAIEANLRGFTLAQEQVGISGTAFFTNSSVEIPGLTIEQLRQVFTGELTNWKQVGGADLPIKPVAVKVQSLQEIGLGEGELDSNVEVVSSPTLAFREVLGTPGAISFTNAALASQQELINVLAVQNPDTQAYVNPLTPEGEVDLIKFQTGEYPLANNLFVLYRQEDDSLDEVAGKAYAQILLSEEGQRTLQEAGFVPLLPPDQ